MAVVVKGGSTIGVPVFGLLCSTAAPVDRKPARRPVSPRDTGALCVATPPILGLQTPTRWVPNRRVLARGPRETRGADSGATVFRDTAMA